MKSLERLVSFKPDVLYPGHGPVIHDAVNKIQMYIDHRNMRERQIADVLQTNKNDGLTSMDMVKIIYTVRWPGAGQSIARVFQFFDSKFPDSFLFNQFTSGILYIFPVPPCGIIFSENSLKKF